MGPPRKFTEKQEVLTERQKALEESKQRKAEAAKEKKEKIDEKKRQKKIEKKEKDKNIFDNIYEMRFPRHPLSEIYNPENAFRRKTAHDRFNIKQRNYLGQTPLLFAAENCVLSAVIFLLNPDIGADIDETDAIGNTALELAIGIRHLQGHRGSVEKDEKEIKEMVTVLLKQGAYVNKKMAEIARRNKLEEVTKLIDTYLEEGLGEREKAMRAAIEEDDRRLILQLFNEGFPCDKMPSHASILMFARRANKREIFNLFSCIAQLFAIADNPVDEPTCIKDEKFKKFKKLAISLPINIMQLRNSKGQSLFDVLHDVPSSKDEITARGDLLWYLARGYKDDMEAKTKQAAIQSSPSDKSRKRPRDESSLVERKERPIPDDEKSKPSEFGLHAAKTLQQTESQEQENQSTPKKQRRGSTSE